MEKSTQKSQEPISDALREALDAVIRVLEPYVRSGKIPRTPETKASLQKDGSYIYKHFHRASYFHLAILHENEWGNLPAVQASVKCLADSPEVQKNFKAAGFGNIDEYIRAQIIDGFIFKILSDTRRWPPSRSKIEALLSQLEDYLLDFCLSYDALVPLENFESDVSEINLEPSIAIRKLSDQDKEHLLNIALRGRGFESESNVMRYKFAAIIRVSWEKGATRPHHSEGIEKLLTALRLFKPGAVGANVTYTQVSRWQPGYVLGGTEKHFYTLPVRGTDYKLTLDEAKGLSSFWQWLNHQQHGKSVEVAVRWFNHGYQDWIPDDRIISFITAFESLFLMPRDKKGKNLKERVSKLLTDSGNRSGLECQVKELWDLRSDIIHAQGYDKTKPARLVQEAEDYLRESIKRYVELERCLTSNTHKDILNWIDGADLDRKKHKLFPRWAAIRP